MANCKRNERSERSKLAFLVELHASRQHEYFVGNGKETRLKDEEGDRMTLPPM